MAAVHPNQVLPNYIAIASGAAAPSEGFFIALTDIPGLTATLADEVTGNFDSVIFNLLSSAESKYNSLASTAKSARTTITRSTPSGAGNNLINLGLSMTNTLDIAAAQVAAEPA